ncbi:MAG: class II fumarate hydratase [Gammaproteobacteria bacterium]|nr:class II fumarate hydratase [Gammaproteobacteria bacterium]NNJ49188.1 class II fumarate hydratase [Gammaproteobacteria bacterium]
MSDYRIERDSMGELQVPADAAYGAQTQRAIENFPISGVTMPESFIKALGLVKQACANANHQLGTLDESHRRAISAVCDDIKDGKLMSQFPLDVFQTGSATSTNMNANEVIARLASLQARDEIHPNDHVNMSQSSNDVIPTTIHVSAAIDCQQNLIPAINHLILTIEEKAETVASIVTTGRTHLMDAMPVSLGQELSGWAAQLKSALSHIERTLPDVLQLAIGGTAVGTGINAAPAFGDLVAEQLASSTGLRFSVAHNRFAALSSQDTAVALSGQLKTLATALMKISNDLRWMNSGPLAGIGEIALPALQPGSSIMPGKVNPVIPEATAMVCAQVTGNDSAITIAGQSGNFQLNVMLPLVAYNLLQSIEILSNASRLLADKAIAGFTVNEDNINAALAKNPILVTALNTVIGYELGAKIAKTAYAEGRAVIDVADEMSELSRDELEKLLDPVKLIEGGS